MSKHIEAILFDVGGTLRGSRKRTEPEKLAVVNRIISLLGADLAAADFLELLSDRYKSYRAWSRKTYVELTEADQWTQWLLPDWPEAQIRQLALELNQLWRQATGDRSVFPETREVVLELFNRGYRLGVISNTVSSVEVPDVLEDLGISGCFEFILLSCVEGIRKPDPAIFVEATRRMEISPDRCAYVGNRLDRDVIPSRKVGFSKSVILLDPDDDQPQYTEDPLLAPDHYIDNLKDLLRIFPALPDQPPVNQVFLASISTMWAKKFPSLGIFLEVSRRLGFQKVELNHQLDSAMLANMDLQKVKVSSIHEPCPADISTGELKNRDWMMSAVDENCREKGVEAIQRSIDLAGTLGVRTIVVHSGMVSPDLSSEQKLRELYASGERGSGEYLAIKAMMIEERNDLAPARLESVRRSLIELLDYAGPHDIRLGLENRYHYFDIPSPDELSEFLSLGEPDQIGFIYDVGHAEALDRLGFFPHQEWLEKFSHRIYGVHFHDVKGIDDHYAPGLGEVNYLLLAAYLPPEAFRTLEVQAFNSVEQVKGSLELLAECGCIRHL